MKPNIVFVNEKDGYVTISKEELEKLLDNVYWNGYNDGTASHWFTYPYPYYTTTTSENVNGLGSSVEIK